jgi:hypothetical protein
MNGAMAVDISAVSAWLAGLGALADDALEGAAAEISDRLLAPAADNRSASGLKERTGTLRASLAAQLVESGDGFRAMVTADAPYAAYQEYGFHGEENVRSYLRRQTVAFGRPMAPKQVQVRAFTRHVDYAGHSYLRAALAEIAPDISALLTAALAEAIGP